jgi:hypothetical protein
MKGLQFSGAMAVALCNGRRTQTRPTSGLHDVNGADNAGEKQTPVLSGWLTNSVANP